MQLDPPQNFPSLSLDHVSFCFFSGKRMIGSSNSSEAARDTQKFRKFIRRPHLHIHRLLRLRRSAPNFNISVFIFVGEEMSLLMLFRKNV